MAALPLAWRADMRLVHAIASVGKGPRARPARRLVHKHLGASKRAENGYVRELQKIMRAVHRAVLARLETRLEAPERRQDDEADDVIEPGFLRLLLAWVSRRVLGAFGTMAALVTRKSAAAYKALGITPSSAGIEAIVEEARDASIRLVERAARAYAADVRAIIGDPANLGVRVEALRDLLAERGNVSLGRAALIARDQTLKTNAAIARARMQAAGVTSYRWSTSHDERVRQLHRILDGGAFEFDDPPVTARDGSTNNPGEDYQCRCIPIPIIEELEQAAEAEPYDVAAEE